MYGSYFYKADLSNIDLSYANLEGTDLRDVNLSGSNLTGSTFKNTKLTNSKIDNVISDNLAYLIIEHSYQNSIEPVSQSFGYVQRAIMKVFDEYIINSI